MEEKQFLPLKLNKPAKFSILTVQELDNYFVIVEIFRCIYFVKCYFGFVIKVCVYIGFYDNLSFSYMNSETTDTENFVLGVKFFLPVSCGVDMMTGLNIFPPSNFDIVIVLHIFSRDSPIF